MLRIFSTREIAIGIYIVLFIVYTFSKSNIRKEFKNVVKCALTKKLIIPFFVLMIYAVIILCVLQIFSFWKWIYLKDLIIWVLFVGVPLCFNAVEHKIEKQYFSKVIIDNIKFTVLVEYVVGAFTFNLVVELILQPIIFIISIMSAFAEKDDKYKAAKKFLDFILAIIGFMVLGLTIKELIDSFNTIDYVDVLFGLISPLLLSIAYIPFAYGFAIYSKYESIFIKFKIVDKNQYNSSRRYSAIRACKLSYKKLCIFERNIMRYIFANMKNEDFNKAIEKITEIINSELNNFEQ